MKSAIKLIIFLWSISAVYGLTYVLSVKPGYTATGQLKFELDCQKRTDQKLKAFTLLHSRTEKSVWACVFYPYGEGTSTIVYSIAPSGCNETVSPKKLKPGEQYALEVIGMGCYGKQSFIYSPPN